MADTPSMDQFRNLAELVSKLTDSSVKLVDAIHLLSESVGELSRRQVRLETRVVKLASHLGLDANGDRR